MREVSLGVAPVLGINVPVTQKQPLELNSLIREADRQPMWQGLTRALEAGNSYELEYRVKHGRGHWLTVYEQGEAVRDKNNGVVGLEGCIMDVTVRAARERGRRLQEFDAFQAEKGGAINVLASGVAHDFNNIIAGILGSAELVKMEIEDQPGQPGLDFLQQIFVAGERARDLIHQIKTFSQRQPAERHLAPLPPIVSEAVQLVRSSVPAGLEIECDLAQEYPAILADAVQLREAIVNLCTHTWHSLPNGKGKIEIKLALMDLSPEKTAPYPQLQNGPCLCLSLRDNGPGVSKSNQTRVFEPFAHRRPNGRKSGLELFQVREIMAAHQGAIFLESEPGVGTVFQLCFPQAH